jgi:hypothetical protein
MTRLAAFAPGTIHINDRYLRKTGIKWREGSLEHAPPAEPVLLG